MNTPKNILFVVHRYAPFPGGSEYYVQNMAEEALARGHTVTVLTGEHKAVLGKHNGVWVVDNPTETLNRQWDLIVVHGGDVHMQNIVHMHNFNIRSPILYMIIKPSNSEVCLHGMRFSDFLGYSTMADLNHIANAGYLDKARRVRHGIKTDEWMAESDSCLDSYLDREFVKEGDPYFVSAGGFWPHKAMKELADAWNGSPIDAKLVIYGYGMPENAPQQTDKVRVITDAEFDEVQWAIYKSNGYIMNSYEEGFGLVLLEAMYNGVPWFARRTPGAIKLQKHGFVYDSEPELMEFIEYVYQDDDRDWWNGIALDDYFNNPCIECTGTEYVIQNHSIGCTVDDIEDVLIELDKRKW